MTIENVLKNRVATDRCQWMENGQIYKIEELSREDLMQVAAQSLELINRTENRILKLCHGAQADMELWHRGRPLLPDPEVDN
jgi:hypothetical protein